MKTAKRHTSRSPHPASRILHPASCTLRPASYLLIAILLLAAFLRFYRLDTQSLWNDEGNSARIAERSLDLILEGAEGDIHPPGYYVLLHYWRAVCGQSEFALRSLSVAGGLATVIFTYLLGRHLFNEATGLTAAFLGAISPFAVYYSQEARMYAPLAALSAASTYLLIRLITGAKSKVQSPKSKPQSPVSNLHSPSSILKSETPGNLWPCILVAYILTSAAGLYTHYFFPFVLLVHNVTFGLWWVAVARRSARPWQWVALWGGTQVAILLLYLPWLPIALQSTTGWSSAGRAYELGPALLDVWHVLNVGITLPTEQATAIHVVSGLLLLASLWPVPRTPGTGHSDKRGYQADRTGWFGVAIMALYLLLPIFLIFDFDLYKPSWLKFLVVVLPPFHVLVARGIETLTRFPPLHSPSSILRSPLAIRNSQFAIRILSMAFLAITTFPSLHNLYFDPAYARDDYHQLTADVATSARPGDGIILNAPNQWEVFTYYYPNQDVHPAPYRPTAAEVDRFLAPLVEQYRHLFVLYWGDAESDPQRLIESWLATHAYHTDDKWYGRVRLAAYRIAPLPTKPATALNAQFGETIRLRGYTLAGDWFAPGDVLPVTLFWETQAPITERYKVTVQLLDGTGQLVAQHDTEPGDGLIPTPIWEPGQVLADRYGVSLPLDVPPGRYTLIAGLYHVVSGERLSVGTGGDHVVLGTVEVKSSLALLSAQLPNTTYARLYIAPQPIPASPPTGTCCTNWSGLYHNVRESYQGVDSHWVLTEVGLMRFDLTGKLLAFYTRPEHAPLDWGMEVMAPDGRGGVWLGTDDGVWWLNDDRWSHLLTTDQPIRHMMVDANGELWVATYDQAGRYSRGQGGVDSCMHAGRPPGHAVPAPPTSVVLYHALDNGAWESWSGLIGNTNVPAPISVHTYCHQWTWVSPASTCSDVAHPAPALEDVQRGIEATDLPLLPPTSFHHAYGGITVDHRGAVWTESGTTGGGLLWFETGTWSRVTPGQGGPCHSACTLWSGRGSSLWTGSYPGICRWDDRQVTMSAEMGAVASLVQDWEGRVWAGLVRKGAARLDGNTWSHFDSASGALPSDLVTCMAVDTARQRLYVGTHGGLAMFDGQDWHDLGDPIAEMPMWMNALAVDDGGGVWVGYYSGPTRAGEFAGYLLRYADGTWEHIRLPAPGAVGALLVDRVGRLWVGLIPGGFSIYAAFQPSIGTLDTPAVCSYHNGEWRSVGAAQGLGVPAILALAEGHDGVIWAAGVVGIGAIDPSSIWAEH